MLLFIAETFPVVSHPWGSWYTSYTFLIPQSSCNHKKEGYHGECREVSFQTVQFIGALC